MNQARCDAPARMLRACSILALIGVLGAPPCVAQVTVLDGPVAYQGHSYYLLSQSTWTQAEAAAVGLGGHLVTIGDEPENAFVFDRWGMFGGQARGLWIGLNDAAVLFQFVWVSGQPVVFTDWGKGEPNNWGGDERYAHILWPGEPRAGHWNDAPDASAPFGPTMHGVVEVDDVCYPDCNTDGALTVADFGCFQTKMVAADPYADCNGDGQRTVADFGCFQTKFVVGCP